MHPPTRRLAADALALLIAALVAAAVAAAFAAPAGAVEGPAALSPCHLEGLAEEVRCGVVAVPEDRSRRDGRTIDVHFAVVPARRPRPELPPLVVLAGGPGQGSLAYAPAVEAFFGPARARHDLVLVDLRGTGRSSPLACEPADDVAMLEGRFDGADCAPQLDADPRLYGSLAAADDLEAVRKALAVPRLDLWGGSFGTRQALVYMLRHPGRTRAAVLDGPVPLAHRVPLAMAADAAAVLERLAQRCEAEPGCRALHPDLVGEVEALLAGLDAAPARIATRHPRTGAPLAVTLGRDAVASGLRTLLYRPEDAAFLPFAVAAAQGGDWSPFLAAIVAAGEATTATMALGATLAVICSEDLPRISDGEADAAAVGFVGPAELRLWRRLCAGWPLGPPLPLEWATASVDVPALLLAGSDDPATPPRWSEAMRRHLPRSRALVALGGGHNVTPLGCMPELVAAFLDEPDPERLDASCLAPLPAPTTFLSLAGPVAAATGAGRSGR